MTSPYTGVHGRADRATPTHPNPRCTVCRGAGTDPDFGGECTECWPRRAVIAAHVVARLEQLQAAYPDTLGPTPTPTPPGMGYAMSTPGRLQWKVTLTPGGIAPELGDPTR